MQDLEKKTDWVKVIILTVITFGIYLVIKKNWRYIWPVLVLIYAIAFFTTDYAGANHKIYWTHVDRSQLDFTYSADNAEVRGILANNSDRAIEDYTVTCRTNGDETTLVFHHNIPAHSTGSETVYSYGLGEGTGCEMTDWDNYHE